MNILPNKLLKIFFIIIAITTVGGSAFYFTNKPGIDKIADKPEVDKVTNFTDEPRVNKITNEIIVNGYKKDYIHKIGSSGAVESQQLVFVSPQGNKILIPDNIATLLDGPTRFEKTKNSTGQNITSFDMPIHPQNKDVIFFSTAENIGVKYSKIINRIYSYDIATSKLTEIYKENVQSKYPTSTSGSRILRTAGIDGSKIIVLYDGPNNSPGPCTEIWYHYKDKFGYLEFSNIIAGLKSYIVPQYMINEAKQNSEKCLNEPEISAWKIFNNDYLSFKHPTAWTVKNTMLKGKKTGFVTINSPDKKTAIIILKSQNNTTDWYEFNRALDSENISNEREIKIDDLTAKAYDVVDASGTETTIVLKTLNYAYTITTSPNINNAFLSKIINTVKVNSR